MKRYAISSLWFETLDEAKDKIEEFVEADKLDDKAEIFESSIVYIPIVEKKIRYTKGERIK